MFLDQTSSCRLSLLVLSLFCENNLSYLRFLSLPIFISTLPLSSSSWKISAAAQGPARLSVFAISGASFISRLIPATSWQSKALNGSKQGHVPIIQQSFNRRRSELSFPFDSTGFFRFHQLFSATTWCLNITQTLPPPRPTHTPMTELSQYWPLPRIHRCREAQQSPLLVAFVGGFYSIVELRSFLFTS